MLNLKFHAIAEIFPLMLEEELAELAEDIRETGQREPIILHPDGSILDGRNRYIACGRIGVTPNIDPQPYEGDPLSYVVSRNLRRRHLDASQRAMIAAKIANLGEGRPSKTASFAAVPQAEAARVMSVSRSAVQRAAIVRKEGAPNVVEAVERGEVPVSLAAKAVKLVGKDAQQSWTVQDVKLAAVAPPKPRQEPSVSLSLADIPKAVTPLFRELSTALRSLPAETLCDIARALGDQAERIRELPVARRIALGRELLRVLGVSHDDLAPSV